MTSCRASVAQRAPVLRCVWRCLATVSLLVACALPAAAVTEKPVGSVALTIYSTAQPGAIPAEMYRPVPQTQAGSYYRPQGGTAIPGFAVVKQERDITLDKGSNTVRFTDVAALIDPTTVTFTSLSDPDGTHVLEQNYQFDLVSTASLLERYRDRTITVEQAHGNTVDTITGTLASTAGGMILKDTNGAVQIINGYQNVRLPELPGGLITKPTLVWEIAAAKSGTQQARVTYQTDGIAWWADYNAVFSEGKDANSGLLNIGAWVSIINQSGATYSDAKLKLIAGDVPAHRWFSGGNGVQGETGGVHECRAGFRGKGVLRVSSVHARPFHYALGQLDETDRAVPGGTASPV